MKFGYVFLNMTFIAAILSGNLLAADDYAIKVCSCPVAGSRITLDGKLDEPCWQQAPLAGGFMIYGSSRVASPQTFFRVLYSNTHLYFGIVCDEPNMKQLIPVKEARDSHGIFRQESVELFIDAAHDHAHYKHIAMNAVGSVFDENGRDVYWNGNEQVAASRSAKCWILEIAIPWTDLGVTPGKGMILGINLCRNRKLGKGRQWSYWSRTRGGFHDPERFGHIVLSLDGSRLAALSSKLRKGGRSGKLAIYGRTGLARVSYQALLKQSLAKLEQELGRIDRVRQNEPDPAARQALGELIGRYRGELARVRSVTAGKARVNIADWMRIDQEVNQIMDKLGKAVWQARLQALLKRV